MDPRAPEPGDPPVAELSRREALALGVGALVVGCTPGGKAPADRVDSAPEADSDADADTDADSDVDTGDPIPESCPLTPERGEGPYYRPDAPFRTDLNVHGVAGIALRITGHVRTAAGCAPLAGALLDVWHAMQGPPTPPYDMDSADFDFRGRQLTDAFGRFSLDTLRPPNYGDASDGHMVQTHIHVKVTAEGYRPIVTQIVFSDDPYNGDHDPTVEVSPVDDGAGTSLVSHDFVLEPA